MKLDLEKWSHRATPLYMVLLVVTGPTAFLPNNWWGRLIDIVSVLPVLALVLLGSIHGSDRFCEYCASASPLDGNEAARKKRRTLRFYHQIVSVWGLVYIALMIIIPSVLPKTWPSLIGWAVFIPGFLWMVWSMRVHDLLKPWCPYCNHGRGDGDGLLEPEPGPSHGIPVPVFQGQR